MRMWLASMLVVAGVDTAVAEPLASTAFNNDLSQFDDAIIYGGLLGPAEERMTELKERERALRLDGACRSDVFSPLSPEAPSRWPAVLAILVALVVARASTRVGELQ